MAVDQPVRKTMCVTCPYREGSPTAYLKLALLDTILTESKFCHSTGNNNAFHEETGLPEHICRGSRDLQLRILAQSGFLREATDEAWNEQRIACGMKPQIIQNPKRKKGKDQ